ncbi:hypothetical protein GCM10023210_28780 [Chryseobacterium ginsengisoli]|uniref:Lipoprotein n=1 Tax=Chryseobacterium ginsengisoli TaxID=363853 RepID=A0ABP9MFS6_9FLAO
MRIIILLIISLTFFSCKKAEKINSTVSKAVQDSPVVIKDDQPEKELSNEEILKIQQEEERERSQIIRKYTIEKTNNNFKYKIYCEEQKNEVVNLRKIKILKSGKLIQEIKIPKDSAIIYHDYEFDFSSNEDWNFDGFPDVKMIKFVGMVDVEYYLWIYDKKSKKYNLCQSFSGILNPILNKKDKEITSKYHIGPTEYHFETYNYKNGKFVKTYEQVEGEDY